MQVKAAAATQLGSPATLQELLVVVVLPFAYGASTRCDVFCCVCG